jgi:hypothetical protein
VCDLFSHLFFENIKKTMTVNKKEKVTDLRILVIYQMNVEKTSKNLPLQENPKKNISRFYLITY